VGQADCTYPDRSPSRPTALQVRYQGQSQTSVWILKARVIFFRQERPSPHFLPVFLPRGGGSGGFYGRMTNDTIDECTLEFAQK